MTIQIVTASPAHVGTIAARMREIDRIECAAVGHRPKQALRIGLQGSTYAWTIKADGRPEAMFGVMPVSLLDGEGAPWLLLTEEAMRHKREFLRTAKPVVTLLQTIFPILKNNVHAENSTAIGWLERLGFHVGETFDMRGHPMRPFERRA